MTGGQVIQKGGIRKIEVRLRKKWEEKEKMK